MRVAVTGASGFIGGRVARALSASGHEVHSFGRREASALTQPLPRYQRWDLTEGPHALGHIDAVVHCAAHVGQWGSAALFEAANVHGTENLVQSVSSNVRIVYVSTGSVRHASSNEQLPAYARSKLRGEEIVQRGGRAAAVLRPHIVYGPGDTTLWPKVLSARRGARLFVPGNGRNHVAVTHVDNLVHAVERALAIPSAVGVFEIADTTAPTVHDLLTTMFARYNEPVRLTYIPRSVAYTAALSFEVAWTILRRLTDPPLTRYVVQSLAEPFALDISAAVKQLQYAPRYTYVDGPLR